MGSAEGNLQLWFDLPEARRRILGAQVPLLDVLAAGPRLRPEQPE